MADGRVVVVRGGSAGMKAAEVGGPGPRTRPRPRRHPLGTRAAASSATSPAVGEAALIVDDGEGGWKGIALALRLAGEGEAVHPSTPLPCVGFELKPRHASVRRIGDAVASKSVLEAMHEAERVVPDV